MIFNKKQTFLSLDSIQDELIGYKGNWLMVCQISSVDIDMKSEYETEGILLVFQQILNSFYNSVQIIHRKNLLDFDKQLGGIQKTVAQNRNPKLIKYGNGYVDFLRSALAGKLESVNYLIIKTDTPCTYEEALPYLKAQKEELARALEAINMSLEQVRYQELKLLFELPDYIKEEKDHIIIGKEYKRTYIIYDYGRTAYPNWLKPLLSFQYPLEICQHYHPYPKDKVINMLELNIAKIESTIETQKKAGYVTSSELLVRLRDTEQLLGRLASGEESIIETSFYVTITADSLDELNTRSYQLESTLRHIKVRARKAIREMYKAFISILPLCDDLLMQLYTFDTHSLSVVIPLTSQDRVDYGGIIYAVNKETSSLIMIDKFSLVNPNTLILGVPGYGKSTLAKVEITRHLIHNTQAILIDHNGEYEQLCELLGGSYLKDNEKPDWSNDLIVFQGINKSTALRTIWNHCASKSTWLHKKLLVIDEFHNILLEDKDFMLHAVREIRKTYTSPTLITQNATQFLANDEGKMLYDLCSIKFLLHMGGNDLEAIEKVMQLSQSEKIYLSGCKKGHGIVFTDSFKTRFKVEYSTEEAPYFNTDPHKKGVV